MLPTNSSRPKAECTKLLKQEGLKLKEPWNRKSSTNKHLVACGPEGLSACLALGPIKPSPPQQKTCHVPPKKVRLCRLIMDFCNLLICWVREFGAKSLVNGEGASVGRRPQRPLSIAVLTSAVNEIYHNDVSSASTRSADSSTVSSGKECQRCPSPSAHALQELLQ